MNVTVRTTMLRTITTSDTHAEHVVCGRLRADGRSESLPRHIERHRSRTLLPASASALTAAPAMAPEQAVSSTERLAAATNNRVDLPRLARGPMAGMVGSTHVHTGHGHRGSTAIYPFAEADSGNKSSRRLPVTTTASTGAHLMRALTEAPRRSTWRLLCVCLVSALCAAILGACDLVPQKPEAVFVLFRDRMKQEKVSEARTLLTKESHDLAVALKAKYRLSQEQSEPEALALLSALDPVAEPVVLKAADEYAVLHVRTIKGVMQVVRLVKQDPKTGWKIDLKDELTALESYLVAREAFGMVRNMAGEFAAALKAFNTQIKRIKEQGPSANSESPTKPEASQAEPNGRGKPLR
ncbi:MAG: hypothetical protein AB1646_23545 [Thermodesulfobacteriota bacterium]